AVTVVFGKAISGQDRARIDLKIEQTSLRAFRVYNAGPCPLEGDHHRRARCQDQFEIPQNDQVENPQLKRSVRAGWANSPSGPNYPAGQAGPPRGAFRASDNSGREY